MRLFREIAAIRLQVPKDSVATRMTVCRWQERWKPEREETSSSESRLHFSHYIAGAEDDCISQFHAEKVGVAIKHWMALDRWSRGVSVMLEKLFGVTLVSKLRDILLMEAELNTSDKETFGINMLDNARKYKLIPDEIFSECNRTADDGGLENCCSMT